MIGDEALVPPYTAHPLKPNVWYTATPVAGSATAATSATVRIEQPLSVCQAGLASTIEQPLPGPPKVLCQTDSDQPRALTSRTRAVPPTAVTYCDAAGYVTPKSSSPELATTATPGWL